MSDLQVTGDRLARDGRRRSESSTGRRDDPGPYRDKDTGNADDGERRGQAGRLGGEPDEDGLVEVRKHLAGQGETPIRRLGPGDCFGEIALLGDHVRTASTHSLTSANVLAIDRDACQVLLSTRRYTRPRRGHDERRVFEGPGGARDRGGVDGVPISPTACGGRCARTTPRTARPGTILLTITRARAYRWGEKGIPGISDNHRRLCFAVALWNGRDPILKERYFGLTGSEGNHGEDVKE